MCEVDFSTYSGRKWVKMDKTQQQLKATCKIWCSLFPSTIHLYVAVVNMDSCTNALAMITLLAQSNRHSRQMTLFTCPTSFYFMKLLPKTKS